MSRVIMRAAEGSEYEAVSQLEDSEMIWVSIGDKREKLGNGFGNKLIF
jgi:hypothetical protein